MRQPLRSGLAYRVVRVTGLRDDSLVEIPMQFSELVHHSGLGHAADFPPSALPVLGVAQRHFATPQPWTMSVPFRVPAGTPVFERDPVFAAPAPSDHGEMLARGGDYWW